MVISRKTYNRDGLLNIVLLLFILLNKILVKKNTKKAQTL